MAIVFAMLTSYFLSRTLVPTMERHLLSRESLDPSTARGPIARLHGFIERGFDRTRDAYAGALTRALAGRKTFITVFATLVVLSLALVPLLGQDFFPAVDAGQ